MISTFLCSHERHSKDLIFQHLYIINNLPLQIFFFIKWYENIFKKSVIKCLILFQINANGDLRSHPPWVVVLQLKSFLKTLSSDLRLPMAMAVARQDSKQHDLQGATWPPMAVVPPHAPPAGAAVSWDSLWEAPVLLRLTCGKWGLRHWVSEISLFQTCNSRQDLLINKTVYIEPPDKGLP